VTGRRKSLMINGRRQSSCDGTSRMNREVHVRFCERLGVQFPGPTRHRRPRLLMPRVLECPLRSALRRARRARGQAAAPPMADMNSRRVMLSMGAFLFRPRCAR
jgi:hypothetical protein